LPMNERVGSIVYTQYVPELPPVLSDVSSRVYDTFKKRLTTQLGNEDFEASIGALFPEFDVFLASIKDREPRERIEAIERFVRDVGYYDFDNREVQALKRDVSFTERLRIMRERMEQIKTRSTSDDTSSSALANKQLAGICADFNLLTTALLRRSGVLAGCMRGFVLPAGEQSITTAHSHLKSFVLWPNERGESIVVPVDGTPGGETEEEQRVLAGVRLPVLAERAEERKQLEKDIVQVAEKRLQELLEIAQGTDVEAIKQLDNGELERVVNAILRAEVKESHVDAIRSVLSAARYSPAKLSDADFSDPTQRANLLSWATSSIESARSVSGSVESSPKLPAGTQFITLIQEFKRRFASDFDINQEDAITLVGKVIDLCGHQLNDTERRAATAVVTYLKAKQKAM
ncbi:MAG: hypothetical protein ABIG71_01690, partial [Candidatus Uhrbacteria bacterium]